MKEQDPFGKDPHVGGAKMDGGKVKVNLMLTDFSLAIMEVAKVTTYGADKYCASGWIEVPDATKRYADAKARHMLKGYSETYDESGFRHAAMEAWNCLAVLELQLREKEPKP